MNIATLHNFIDKHARHNLLFVQADIEDLQFVDIGKELSLKLDNKQTSKMLSMIAEDSLDMIIDSNTKNHPILGEYVAIKNIGILFEEQLKMNLRNKLDQYSRTRILIVKLEGTIQQHTFYLGKATTPSYAFSLEEVGYQVIYENI